ncbi:MAG: hypothetical protein KUG79_01870 [Pseudomonadales bacterium]|nr:hypothetical protein [Pseudomonadales bacterium]
MENWVGLSIALIVGLVVGGAITYILAGRSKIEAITEPVAPTPKWWELRKTLTGTQMQILQYMEAQREQTIEQLQEKFSFIPDRELYYRLEQIALMGFMGRGRRDGGVFYTLNEAYSLTVEDDKTVMLPPSS